MINHQQSVNGRFFVEEQNNKVLLQQFIIIYYVKEHKSTFVVCKCS